MQNQRAAGHLQLYLVALFLLGWQTLIEGFRFEKNCLWEKFLSFKARSNAFMCLFNWFIVGQLSYTHILLERSSLRGGVISDRQLLTAGTDSVLALAVLCFSTLMIATVAPFFDLPQTIYPPSNNGAIVQLELAYSVSQVVIQILSN